MGEDQLRAGCKAGWQVRAQSVDLSEPAREWISNTINLIAPITGESQEEQGVRDRRTGQVLQVPLSVPNRNGPISERCVAPPMVEGSLRTSQGRGGRMSSSVLRKFL